jgi:N-acetylmuramoyl-L-alanine amidase CwlA
MVLHAIPNDEVGWHCGCDVNYESLGIEVVPAETDGRFSWRSISTLRALLNTLPSVYLRRHYDWTRKECPLYYVDEDKWSELLQEVRNG